MTGASDDDMIVCNDSKCCCGLRRGCAPVWLIIHNDHRLSTVFKRLANHLPQVLWRVLNSYALVNFLRDQRIFVIEIENAKSLNFPAIHAGLAIGDQMFTSQ